MAAAQPGKKSTKKLARPTPQNVGDVRIRVLRGPNDKGQWYWRAGRNAGGKETMVWTGWGAPHEAVGAVVALVAQGPDAKRDRNKNAVETVRDLCSVYLANREDDATVKPSTVVTLRNMLKRVCNGIGDVRLDRLDDATLARHRDASLRANLAPDSIKAELKRLCAAWKWGRTLAITPVRDLTLPRIVVTPRNCATTPEQADVIAVLALLDGWMRVVVALYSATGARLGELADLEWGDDGKEDKKRTISVVHLKQAVVYVVGKTGHRPIPVEAPVVRLLTGWKATSSSARVWPVTPGTVKAKVLPALTAACKTAAVPRFTAQGLRRAVVDLLYDCGVDVHSAATIMGHSPAVALQHYRRAKPKNCRKAVSMARLGHFEQIVPPNPAVVERVRLALLSAGVVMPDAELQLLVGSYWSDRHTKPSQIEFDGVDGRFH